jgi:hypothetical protein
MQSEHFVGRICAGVKREGLVLQSHNIRYEQEGRQKENNDKAVDNDDGQKPVLERSVDNTETPSLVPAHHEISFLMDLAFSIEILPFLT